MVFPEEYGGRGGVMEFRHAGRKRYGASAVGAIFICPRSSPGDDL